MTDMFTQLKDEEIREIILAHDRQSMPLTRRFDGDDQAIRDAMEALGHPPLIANMVLVAGLAMREALARGITISRPN